MKSILSAQYEMVLDSRKVLLDYCSTIPHEDFLRSSPNFGKGGCMRNMMVHICNTYQGWLANFVEGRTAREMEPSAINTLSECIDYYKATDDLVLAFIARYENNPLDVVQVIVDGEAFAYSPLTLFTHVVTHEFHHKGQILSLSRLWGHTPFDTDILR